MSVCEICIHTYSRRYRLTSLIISDFWLYYTIIYAHHCICWLFNTFHSLLTTMFYLDVYLWWEIHLCIENTAPLPSTLFSPWRYMLPLSDNTPSVDIYWCWCIPLSVNIPFRMGITPPPHTYRVIVPLVYLSVRENRAVGPVAWPSPYSHRVAGSDL